MEYTHDIEVEGQTVEIATEVDEDWMYDCVTEDSSTEWAMNHFEECCNVAEYIDEYLESLSSDELAELVAPLMGIK